MSDMKELPKAYDASAVEDKIYAAWEQSGYFNPDTLPDRNQKGEPYSIIMPPPNRTGTLHMGHATMLAIEDLLIRFQRMRGKKTLWLPGTDHAAIATQVKVEQLLIKQGMKNPREELGREKFLEEVVEFAEDSAKTIRSQVRKMGSSCDWSREKYTLDDERNRAVNEMFKQMHEDGIIERGDRMVNWDPGFKTVISDDEVVWKEEKAPFYTFKYGPFEIGTSRPETKFGDKYVVMHPEDERYASFKEGQKIELEWINGPITATVIKDAVVDREFGTGVMTITPWHDQVDYDLAERRGLDKEQVIDMDGRLLPVAGEFVGMSILEAREKVVEKLKKKGLLVKVDEDYVHRVATAERGGTLIEPQISRQWFIRVNKKFKLRQNTLGKWKKGDPVTLKELMIEAVQSKQTKIVPERFEKIYFHWINNLRDWCISRQIWFGHRIPVWYRGEEMVVSDKAPGADWEQDPDTLDTWFSSGLWTFSTLGWPEQTSDLKTYHPTAVLETGYDILFFWVARMILMSTYALGEVPFKDVYLHGLVRDEQGRKMSKSLGNILDPLDLIPKYGTDAVRLSLLIGTSPGQDMKLSEEKIAGFRNFTNKLWNISRYIIAVAGDPPPGMRETLADKWILDRLSTVVDSVTKKLETYQFSSAGEELRDFTWNDLADWYLEIAKIEKGKYPVLNFVLQTILKLWHPFMPFVTEHIWSVAGMRGQLIVEDWPSIKIEHRNEAAAKDFEILRAIVKDFWAMRSEHKIVASQIVETVILGEGPVQKLVKENAWVMVRASGEMKLLKEIPSDWMVTTSGSVTIGINLSTALDVTKEKAKIEKELQVTTDYLQTLEQKLANQEFMSKAPAHVIDGMKEKRADGKKKRDALEKRLQELGS